MLFHLERRPANKQREKRHKNRNFQGIELEIREAEQKSRKYHESKNQLLKAELSCELRPWAGRLNNLRTKYFGANRQTPGRLQKHRVDKIVYDAETQS